MLEKLSDGEKDAVKIEKFWLNNPQKHVKVNQVQNNVKPSTLKQRTAQLFDQGGKNLLEQIEALHIPVEEKFAQPVFRRNILTNKWEATPLQEKGFIGFTIIGPTKAYFEKLAPNMRYDNLKGYSYDAKDDDAAFKPTATCLSKALDDASDDTSVHNQSSIMFVFEPEQGKKFLFTGYA